MARIARVVVPGCPHHVAHKGNLRTDLFFRPEDRDLYKEVLDQAARQFGLEVWAFCLMANHIHLIVVPRDKMSLGLAIGRAHQRYAAAINAREKWTGHLWANRYFSAPLDGEALWTAVKYVELNPVRAGIVDHAEQYQWSSAPCHCGMAEEPLLWPGRFFPGDVPNWAEFLAAGVPEKDEQALRLATYRGRPCGSPDFVSRLEDRLGRVLHPRKRGRKPKKQLAEVTPIARRTEQMFDTDDLFGDF